MKKFYFFDFDGTLTRKDTMFLFLRFASPSKYRFQYLRHIPLFILVKLKLIDAAQVKKSFISSLLKGKTQEFIERKSQAFFAEYYPSLIRERALDFIQKIDRDKTDSYLVTASLDIWVKPFAEEFKMNLISTEAYFKDGVFTGEFKTPNCNGREKVTRIKAQIQGKKYDKTIAFGDTSGDKPMLQWANESYFRFFH